LASTGAQLSGNLTAVRGLCVARCSLIKHFLPKWNPVCAILPIWREGKSVPTQLPVSAESDKDCSYSYRPSLIGAPWRFELTDHGLSWRVSGKSGVWPYAAIAAIRLSYRPVTMQSRRFRADIRND